ncbi:MAG: histidine kinase [Dysgonomonas sp.]
MKHLKYLFILIVILAAQPNRAQTPIGKGTPEKESLLKVSKDIEAGKSDEVIAGGYEKLAKDFASKGDFAKAEDYYKRAKKLYEKSKNKLKAAAIDREIAKTQEAQGKVTEAIASYGSASNTLQGQVHGIINANDASRLSKKKNPQAQAVLIQQNIDLLEKTDNTEDKIVARQQMAQVKTYMGDNKGARKELTLALRETESNSENSFIIKKEIADTYLADNQPDKAIELNKDLVAEIKKTNNPKAEVKQLQNLSTNYIEANKPSEGIQTLRQAYDLAVNNGQTLEAKNSLELLIEQYKKIKQPQKALEAYADFMSRLEILVKKDSTLIDEKFFQIQEKKILQLEKERELKDALISKTNTFNYVLIVAIILVLIFLIFIAKALYSIKKKNKKIALQSLRREMNPHFIFNSLNSVNQFIAQNNELEANKYLSSYSKLMRNIMENSNKDFIPLSTEIEQMKEYLDLEYMRFNDKFKYIMDIDSSLDTDAIYIPNMLIQPQLENAIWHGLRYKENRGLLSLTIKEDNGHILAIIQDNGIGLKKSKELKTKHQKEHNSRGLTNTKERINLLNSLYNTNITITVAENESEDTGVTVTLQFPLMEEKV